MCGAVVRGKHHDGIFGQAQFLDQIQDAADVGVHSGNHGGISGTRSKVRCITITLVPGKRRIIPFLSQVRLQFLIGHVQGDVRYDGWVIEKERLVLVFADEGQGLLVDTVGGIVLSLEDVVTARIGGIGAFRQRGMPRHRRFIIQGNALEIAPKIIRVIAVGVPLTVVTEEAIEPLMDGITLRARSA